MAGPKFAPWRSSRVSATPSASIDVRAVVPRVFDPGLISVIPPGSSQNRPSRRGWGYTLRVEFRLARRAVAGGSVPSRPSTNLCDPSGIGPTKRLSHGGRAARTPKKVALAQSKTCPATAAGGSKPSHSKTLPVLFRFGLPVELDTFLPGRVRPPLVGKLFPAKLELGGT